MHFDCLTWGLEVFQLQSKFWVCGKGWGRGWGWGWGWVWVSEWSGCLCCWSFFFPQLLPMPGQAAAVKHKSFWSKCGTHVEAGSVTRTHNGFCNYTQCPGVVLLSSLALAITCWIESLTFNCNYMRNKCEDSKCDSEINKRTERERSCY